MSVSASEDCPTSKKWLTGGSVNDENDDAEEYEEETLLLIDEDDELMLDVLLLWEADASIYSPASARLSSVSCPSRSARNAAISLAARPRVSGVSNRIVIGRSTPFAAAA